MPSPIDPEVLDSWPLSAEMTLYRFDLDDTSDSLSSLPVGGYKVVLKSASADGAVIKLGAAAALPADKASAADVAVLLPGVYVPLYLRATTTLHAKMIATSATGTLYLIKVR